MVFVELKSRQNYLITATKQRKCANEDTQRWKIIKQWISKKIKITSATNLWNRWVLKRENRHKTHEGMKSDLHKPSRSESEMVRGKKGKCHTLDLFLLSSPLPSCHCNGCEAREPEKNSGRSFKIQIGLFQHWANSSQDHATFTGAAVCTERWIFIHQPPPVLPSPISPSSRPFLPSAYRIIIIIIVAACTLGPTRSLYSQRRR